MRARQTRRRSCRKRRTNQTRYRYHPHHRHIGGYEDNQDPEFVELIERGGGYNAIKQYINEIGTVNNDIMATDIDGKSYLHKAVDADNIGAARALLQHPGMDPNAVDSEGATALLYACTDRRRQMVIELLKYPSVDPNKPNNDRMTPLLTAIPFEYNEIVKLLLGSPQIDVNTYMSGAPLNMNPLLYAISEESLPIVKMLLAIPSLNVNINADQRWNAHQSPLIVAATIGNIPIIKELLKRQDLTLSEYQRDQIMFEEPEIYELYLQRFPELKKEMTISILSKKRINRTIRYENQNGVFYVSTMIIPKGTVLFRVSSRNTVADDFYGMAKDGQHYLHSNYNVFFYPYPFSADYLIARGFYHIFVLDRDVEIVMGVEPSPNSRGNRHQDGYIGSCKANHIRSAIPYTAREYDPCFDLKFIDAFPEIVGYIGLAKIDADVHLTNISPALSKYLTYFRDVGVSSNNLRGSERGIGVPEIVLYPLSQRSPTELVFDIKKNPTPPFPFNYTYVSTVMYAIDERDAMLSLMDALLSPDGYLGNHMTIDLATKLYVLWERADEDIQMRCVPIEDENKLAWLRKNYDI